MNRAMLLVTSALVVITTGGTALAQTAPAAKAAQPAKTQSADNDATEVGSVVVQVNKRNELVQDVAVAVTAFTAEQRDELGVISIFDMTRATPSFEYSSAIDRAFIRGIGRNTNAPGTQAGVSLYIDGVYTPLTYGLDRATILSGNLETDNGPQGTLFGRNAIGGVIQQTSAHATDHFQVRTDVRYNDHNRFDGAVSVGGPVNSYLKLIGGADVRHQTKGYFHNLFNGKDQGGPTDESLYYVLGDYKFGNFEGFTKVEFNHYDRYLSQFSQYGATYTALPKYFNDYTYTNGVSPTQNLNCATADPATYHTATPSDAFSLYNKRAYTLANCPANVAQATTYYDPTNYTAQNPYIINQDTRTQFKGHNNWDAVTQMTWHLPWFDTKYIGGYNQYVYDNHQDYDNTARGVFQIDPDGPAGANPAFTVHPNVYNYYENRKWSSHELNFTSTSKTSVSWIYGLYYYHDDFLNTQHINSPGQTELANVINPDGTPYAPGNANLDYYNTSGHAITDSYATFGQVDWQINDKWKLTAGARWNRDVVDTVESDHYFGWTPGQTPAFGFLGNPTVYNPTTKQYGPALNISSVFNPGTCNPVGVAAIPNCTFVPATNTRTINDSWNGSGGMLNLSYKPNDTTLVYAKYSRGYKAGGIAISGAYSVQPILKPEHLNAYELGYKFSPSRTVTINSDVFYYDYRDYQDFGSIPNTFTATSNGLVSVGFNVPKASNVGFEVTGQWHPVHAFTLTFSGNYMNAKVKDGGTVSLVDTLDPLASGTTKIQNQDGTTRVLTYTPSPCGPQITSGASKFQPQCITDDVLKGSSPWKIFVSPQYRIDFDKGSLNLIANYSVRAGNVAAYTKDPIYHAPSYSEVDLRFVWQGAGSKYQVIGFVNNVANKVGSEFVLAGRTTLGPATDPTNYLENVLTIPRTYGVELQAKF